MLNPETPVGEIQPVLIEADLILVMSVHPGFSGQKFMPETIAKVSEIRKKLDALAIIRMAGSGWRDRSRNIAENERSRRHCLCRSDGGLQTSPQGSHVQVFRHCSAQSFKTKITTASGRDFVVSRNLTLYWRFGSGS